MSTTAQPGTVGLRHEVPWFSAADCRLDEFVRVVEAETRPQDYPFAAGVERNVLIYGPDLQQRAADPEVRREIQAELVRALTEGPGIVVFKRAFADTAVVDRATDAFNRLIEAQRSAGTAAGDHFAKPGANDRVWGALDKLAVAAPDVFADYYANDVLALISQAWLGPNYQVTSQVNVVNPGGAKWSPATAPPAFCCAIRSSNAAVARSTTDRSGKAPRNTAMPGPSSSARASSARTSAGSAARSRAAS